MQLFNLEEAKAGKPVCTRGGEFKVISISFPEKPRYPDYPLEAELYGYDRCGNIRKMRLNYTLDGYLLKDEFCEEDLMMQDETDE